MANIMKERINGRKGRGRPRKTFIGEMIEMIECDGKQTYIIIYYAIT